MLHTALLLSLLAGAAAASPNAPNPEQAALAEAGELAVANAAWWGFNEEDATDALQAAINAGAPTVVVPYMGAPWIVRPLRLRGGLEMVFEPGVLVLAKAGAFKGKGDSLFTANNVADLTLRGYGATLRMRHADYMTGAYEPAEWRMVIDLAGCARVTIEGLRLESSGGDGVYLGAGKVPYCKDVVIRDVVCHDNHRQGISVIGAENLLIENCVFSETGGTAPQAGIDFEPNHAKERLVNCVVRNCRFENNKGAGVLLYTKHLSSESAPVSIVVEDCVMRGNEVGIAIGAARDNGPGGEVVFRRCVVERPLHAGAYVYDKSAEAYTVAFEDCHFKDTWRAPRRGGPNAPLLISLRRDTIAKRFGGVRFGKCHVYDDEDRPALVVENDTGDAPARKLHGMVFVHSPHKARADYRHGEPEASDLRVVAAE